MIFLIFVKINRLSLKCIEFRYSNYQMRLEFSVMTLKLTILCAGVEIGLNVLKILSSTGIVYSTAQNPNLSKSRH